MDDLAVLIAGLDGLSVIIGLVGGFICALVVSRFNRRSVLNHVSEHLADEVKNTFEGVTGEMESSFKSLSSQALTSNQSEFLTLADRELDKKTEQHATELDSKKELIDQQLEQMTDTLKTVPTELDKSQKNVSQVIEKSTKSLEESNKTHLTQLQTRSDSQTKEHIAKLDEKELLINRRLSEMDKKLGDVQKLIDEFEKARESKLGALDDQLKNLTQTTSSLQRALADNRARGQWGERMAEDMLNFMGLVEGVNYVKQSAIEAGTRPDFTFLFPNQKSLNMDAKFPLDNYLRYIEADNDADRKEYSQKFLRDVNQRVVEIQKRDYIAAGTLDCVLIFIPNEQIYRFIYEEDQKIIDNALKQKVILCSPLTLYIVLAVIRQAAQNFNIEQRSREIIDVVNDIRQEWEKYTGQMDKLERRFKGMHDDFHALTGTRTRQLDRKFVKIDSVTKSNDLLASGEISQPQLPDGPSHQVDDMPF